MAYTVAVYLIDKAYGGPEEGGWWYTYGYPDDEYSQYTRGFPNDEKESAKLYMKELEKTLIPTLNEGRREISSVISTGRYEVYLNEGNPKPFPETIPRYE